MAGPIVGTLALPVAAICSLALGIPGLPSLEEDSGEYCIQSKTNEPGLPCGPGHGPDSKGTFLGYQL
jgi:hypothetical protein